MPLLSFLSVLPVLGFVYTVCFIAREERAKLSQSVEGPSEMLVRNVPIRQAPSLEKREIKWLSATEFRTLSCRQDDLILIALRKKTETKPIPFPESHVLYTEPDRLMELLRWLPPSSGAVLYGTANRLSSTISEVRNITGSAPIYLTCESVE